MHVHISTLAIGRSHHVAAGAVPPSGVSGAVPSMLAPQQQLAIPVMSPPVREIVLETAPAPPAMGVMAPPTPPPAAPMMPPPSDPIPPTPQQEEEFFTAPPQMPPPAPPQQLHESFMPSSMASSMQQGGFAAPSAPAPPPQQQQPEDFTAPEIQTRAPVGIDDQSDAQLEQVRR